MNERIKELCSKAISDVDGIQNPDTQHMYIPGCFRDRFAELIVRECCLALWTEECHTSDLAFDEVKRNATRIKEHFGIDPNEITEDMLARSIKWMEQQLEDKKHFGVEE
jgi:hypothetical protein